MRNRALFILIGLTLVVVIAAGALGLSAHGPASEARTGDRVLANLAPRVGDVAAIVVHRGEATATIARGSSGTTWTVTEKGDYPADTAKVRQTLLGLAELTYVEPKTSKADLYPRLEVEDKGKSAHVEVKDGSGGKLGELIVGKRRPDRLGTGADGIYIRSPGDAQAWLAQGTLDLPNETKDWLDKKIVSVPASRVKSVTITPLQGPSYVLKRDSAEAKFAVADAPENAKPKSDYAVSEPGSFLDNLELADVQKADAMPFPADGVSKAEIQTFDGLAVTVSVLDRDNTQWVRLAASGSGDAEKEAKEINEKTGPWVYAVAGFKVNPIKAKLDDVIETPKSS
jgi:hypothetical protein